MIGWVAAAAALVLAAAAVLWTRYRSIQLIKRLDGMLTAAMEGRFAEESFDESRLSALESRLARYLAASALSARNLQTQKDQISTLISDISHQTRTPVANLMLYAQLLSEQPLTPREAECVGEISAQAEKLRTLIEALVKTSRLESGILVLHPKSSPIAPAVRRAAAQYLPCAAEKGIALQLGEIEGTALFDPKWTEEALCNLLDNAVKYTPPGGRVSVEVRSYEMFSAIRVTDTGPGIPEHQQAKIFGRFYRAPDAYEQEGVGVGLYLTRQIMENQGGFVKLESAPGRGSTFALFLPRE